MFSKSRKSRLIAEISAKILTFGGHNIKAYKVTVFSNSQKAIRKIQAAKTGAGQALRAQIVKRAKELKASRREMTIR